MPLRPDRGENDASDGSACRLEALLTEKDVAAMLSLEPATLRNWRVKGEGPPFVRLSRRAIRYSRADVSEWLASRTRRSTSATEVNHG